MRILVVTGFFCHLAAAIALADPALPRVVEAARASAILPAAAIDQAEAACATALCFAETLAASLPDRVRLEKVDHPDTDSIRWVRTRPSITVEQTATTRLIGITHFGRKASAELRTALATGSLPAAIDLRGHAGGDFERMLDLARLLIGRRRDAIEIRYRDRIERRSIDGPRLHDVSILRVLIDEKTASAALLLARLLEAHAGAEVVGARAHGKLIFLKHRVPIDHDWRLVIPVAELRIATSHSG